MAPNFTVGFNTALIPLALALIWTDEEAGFSILTLTFESTKDMVLLVI